VISERRGVSPPVSTCAGRGDFADGAVARAPRLCRHVDASGGERDPHIPDVPDFPPDYPVKRVRRVRAAGNE
jgi:hypothetical protein